jgi:hypothetical protein
MLISVIGSLMNIRERKAILEKSVFEPYERWVVFAAHGTRPAMGSFGRRGTPPPVGRSPLPA